MIPICRHQAWSISAQGGSHRCAIVKCILCNSIYDTKMNGHVPIILFQELENLPREVRDIHKWSASHSKEPEVSLHCQSFVERYLHLERFWLQQKAAVCHPHLRPTLSWSWSVCSTTHHLLDATNLFNYSMTCLLQESIWESTHVAVTRITQGVNNFCDILLIIGVSYLPFHCTSNYRSSSRSNPVC